MSKYKLSEWMRARWRGKIYEWKPGDNYGDKWADEVAALETANAELLEALERIRDYSRDILDGTLGEQEHLDEGWVWRVTNDAIRKHKGEDDISDLVAGLEHAADLCDAIQERKAKENER